MDYAFHRQPPLHLKERDIHSLLDPYGPVNSLKLLTKPDSLESQGICFVELTAEGAENAVAALHGQEVDGHKLSVRFVEREDVEDTMPL